MDAQYHSPPYARPPQISPSQGQPRSTDVIKLDAMEVENTSDGSQRAASVLSGLSADDLEAAETLKSLQRGTCDGHGQASTHLT